MSSICILAHRIRAPTVGVMRFHATTLAPRPPRGVHRPLLLLWAGYGLALLAGVEPLRLVLASTLLAHGLAVVGALVGVIMLDAIDAQRRAWMAATVAHACCFASALLPELGHGLFVVGAASALVGVALLGRPSLKMLTLLALTAAGIAIHVPTQITLLVALEPLRLAACLLLFAAALTDSDGTAADPPATW
jgi:hypothetical protein